MTDRAESKRFDPGRSAPIRGGCSGAGVVSLAEARELDDLVRAVLVAVRPFGVLPVLLGWSPELVGELSFVPRVITQSGGLALDLSVD